MLINSKIKAILFDLDRTLLDSKTAEFNAICKFKKMFNELDKINEEELANMWAKIASENYDKYLNKQISYDDLKIVRMKEIFLHYDIKISNEEAIERFNVYSELYKKCWGLFDDAIEVLEKLKNNYKLAIVTNGNSINQREKIRNTGLQKYFSEIIISSEVGFAKPSKEIFEIACKKLNVKSAQCVMVGDKFDVDIKGALDAKIKPIWLNKGTKDINYEFEIKNLKQLLEQKI